MESFIVGVVALVVCCGGTKNTEKQAECERKTGGKLESLETSQNNSDLIEE